MKTAREYERRVEEIVAQGLPPSYNSPALTDLGDICAWAEEALKGDLTPVELDDAETALRLASMHWRASVAHLCRWAHARHQERVGRRLVLILLDIVDDRRTGPHSEIHVPIYRGIRMPGRKKAIKELRGRADRVAVSVLSEAFYDIIFSEA